MLTLYSAPAWAQVTINAGDSVVVDPSAVDGNGAVIHITPGGNQTIISSGQSFNEPVGIAIDSSDCPSGPRCGTIVVTDRGISSTVPAVIRVDPRVANGSNQTIIHAGAPFIDPFGITIGALGTIYITDTGCATHGTNCPTGTTDAKVFSVNPTTGAVTVVSSGQFLRNPFGIEAEAVANSLIVADAFSTTGSGGIIRINTANPATTNQTLLHAGTAGSNPLLSDGCPFGITVHPVTGDIFTSLFHNPTGEPTPPAPGFGCAPGAIWRASPVNGANAPFSGRSPAPGNIPWLLPFGMKVDTNAPNANTILVVDESYHDLYRVFIDGSVTPVSLDGFMGAPTDVDVYTSANIPPNLSQGADLSVTKDDGVTTVAAGDGATYTYTITVRNNGPMTALNVTLTDTWPSGFNRTSLSCAPTTGTSTGNGSFTCSLGNIASGASVTVTANYTVPAATTGSQTNTASVSSDTSDPNSGNNSASDTNNVNAAPTTSADLAITISDSPDPVNVGASLSYTLTISNGGPNTAINLVVTDTLPSGVTVQSMSLSGWACSQSGQTVTCTRPSLDANATSSITINATAPSQPGTIVDQAAVTSSTNDPNTTNNTDTESTTVVAPPAKWSGAGKITVSGGTANFGFKIERTTTNGPINGKLNFFNQVNGLNVQSITITSLVVTGSKAVFKGTAQESTNGGPTSGPWNFTVTVQDLSASGKKDTFEIQISDPNSTHEGSSTTPIKSGNIKQQ
jgi:uncharacterized repeat protein (TIGR01451 family)